MYLQCVQCVQCVSVSCILYYRYASAQSRPPVDSQQDLTESSAVHENGVTTVRFSRKVVTSDSDDDLALNQDLYWLFAYGGTFSGSDPEAIGYHGSNRVVSGGTISLPCECLHMWMVCISWTQSELLYVVFTVGNADAVSIDLSGECSCLTPCSCYSVDSMPCILH